MTEREALSAAREKVRQISNKAPRAVRPGTELLARGTGKGVRALLLLTCAADDGGAVPERAVDAAAAVELFHLATLVHDDIIDDAETRRGVPTINSAFGAKRAVLTGDWLLTKALSLFNAPESAGDYDAALAGKFVNAVSGVCLGELLQTAHLGDAGMSEFTYFRIISGKTASLFYASALAGAVIGGCSERDARNMAMFGKFLGMAFQISDDCKDLGPNAEGKPAGSDVKNGVITLPLITGGAEPAVLRAERYARKAADKIKALPPRKRGLLIEMLGKVTAGAGAF